MTSRESILISIRTRVQSLNMSSDHSSFYRGMEKPHRLNFRDSKNNSGVRFKISVLSKPWFVYVRIQNSFYDLSTDFRLVCALLNRSIVTQYWSLQFTPRWVNSQHFTYRTMKYFWTWNQRRQVSCITTRYSFFCANIGLKHVRARRTENI